LTTNADKKKKLQLLKLLFRLSRASSILSISIWTWRSS